MAPDIAASGDVTLTIWSVDVSLDVHSHARLVGMRIGSDGRQLDAFPFRIAENVLESRVIGTSEGFLVFTDRQFVFVGRDGKLGTRQDTGSDCMIPQAASNGDHVLLVAPAVISAVSPSCRTFSRLLDGRGNIVVSDLGIEAVDAQIAVTSDDRGFVVFRTHELDDPPFSNKYGIQARRIERGGVAMPWQSIVPIINGGRLHAAFDGTSVVVTWHSMEGVRAASVTGNVTRDLGVIAAGDGHVISSGYPMTQSAVASADGLMWLTYDGRTIFDHVIVARLRAGQVEQITHLPKGTSAPRIIATAGGARLVYVTVNGEIESRGFDSGGASPPITLSAAAAAQLDIQTATNGTIRAAAWREQTDLMHGRVAVGGLAADGSRIGPFVLSDAAGDAHALAIGAGARGFLVMWTATGTLKAMRVDRELHPMDPKPIVVATGVTPEATVRVASDGDRWLIVFENRTLAAARISEEGLLLDPLPIVIALPHSAAFVDWHFDVVWSGREFIVAFTFHGAWGPPVPIPTFSGATVIGSDGVVKSSFPLPPDFFVQRIALSDSVFLVAWTTGVSTHWIALPRSAVNDSARAPRGRVIDRQRAAVELTPPHADHFSLRSTALGLELASVDWRGTLRTTTLSPAGSVVAENERPFTYPPQMNVVGDLLFAGDVPTFATIEVTSGAPYGDTVHAFWVLP
jgi:hypothetical protein